MYVWKRRIFEPLVNAVVVVNSSRTLPYLFLLISVIGYPLLSNTCPQYFAIDVVGMLGLGSMGLICSFGSSDRNSYFAGLTNTFWAARSASRALKALYLEIIKHI
jgi:hypothetical protein